MRTSTFLIHRQDLHQTMWATEEIADLLQPDEVLLRVEQFSFTSNNISYIITGDKLGYWRFFPAQAEGYGKVPVWGFATVEKSANSAIQVGERFYGYLPMASHLLVQAGKVKEHGFTDVSPHRQALPAVYNAYQNIAQDDLYTADSEGFQAVFRPLFLTSFLLDDFLATSDFFSAKQVILTGASSKTAFSLAFLLRARRQAKIIGLTSAGNLAFTESLGCYDAVVTYENLPALPAVETVIVDFAGNQDLHFALQTQLGELLAYHSLVGAVHWDKTTAQKPLPKKAFFFFAPEHAQRAMQAWGRQVFQEKTQTAWQTFRLAYASRLELETVQDTSIFSEKYQQIVAGKYPPDKGLLFGF